MIKNKKRTPEQRHRRLITTAAVVLILGILALIPARCAYRALLEQPGQEEPAGN